MNELGQAKQAIEKHPVAAQASKDRFRRLTIAEAGIVLLKEHGQLHGKELERLLKDGGLRSKAENFQSTMVIAFRRNNDFQNIGGNTWRLKEPGSIAGGGANGTETSAYFISDTIPRKISENT